MSHSKGEGDPQDVNLPMVLVEGIQVLARALSSALENTLMASLDGFLTRLDAKLPSVLATPPDPSHRLEGSNPGSLNSAVSPTRPHGLGRWVSRGQDNKIILFLE